MTNTDDSKPAATHTPEPWRIIGKTVKCTDHGRLYNIARVDNKLFTGEANEANARRICAAVNACKGISTEALEQGIVADLLAHLKTLLEQIDEDVPTDITTRHFANSYDEAFATLAKATGRAV
ncbi:MAG TPA: hypothetical protein VH592_23795 [Gemmataceae bacterium]|jgi:hypothetical protein